MKTASNLLDLDYKKAGLTFPSFAPGIVDMHTHILGPACAKVYSRSAATFGILECSSMTPLENLPSVKAVLGENVSFIAMHKSGSTNRLWDMGEGYSPRVRSYYEHGSRVAKFWCAPRAYEWDSNEFASNPMRLDSPVRQVAMETAFNLGMTFMVHVADPDVWFQTKYQDSKRYGTKAQQYGPLEAVLRRFPTRVLAAHMGGWPENLPFLSDLLLRYPNLYLDCSATKWVVRELGRQEPSVVRAFFEQWQDRICFGTDIVASDEHLYAAEAKTDKGTQASSEADAFDLYSSRFWALRTLLETSYDGPSPIEDRDSAAPSVRLRGIGLAPEVLHKIYRQNWIRFLGQ